jgi:small subunit ribosomal protein S17
MAGKQKSLTGTVVSDKMDKTVVVLVESTTRHRLYHKIIKRSKRFMAHDDRLDAKTGDRVRIVETRPLSRHKRWRVAEVVERREVPDIEAREIDTEYLTLQRERQAPPPPKAAAEGEEAAAEGEAPATEGEPPEVSTAAETEQAPEDGETAGETPAEEQDEP